MLGQWTYFHQLHIHCFLLPIHNFWIDFYLTYKGLLIFVVISRINALNLCTSETFLSALPSPTGGEILVVFLHIELNTFGCLYSTRGLIPTRNRRPGCFSFHPACTLCLLQFCLMEISILFINPAMCLCFLPLCIIFHCSAFGGKWLIEMDSLFPPFQTLAFHEKLCILKFLFQFSSVQFSCSVVSDSLRPHESQHARPPCPSPTPGVHPNPCPSSRWCHPTISSSVIPFSSCPQSLPASGSFPMSQFFASGGQSIGASASVSVLPMNTQDWSPLGWTGWISLQSKGLSRVFSNTTVQKHQFFGAQPSL